VSQPPSLLAALAAPDADLPLPRTAVVVAHPDDESVGAGSRLPRLARAQFVYITGGAPADARDAASHGLALDAYAAVRWRELMTALAIFGIGPDRVLNLGYADQGAALRLAQLARALAHLFAAMGTQAVLTHAYEGGHPDHDATAFAVRAAAAVLRRSGHAAPEIVEMGSYHMGPEGIRAGAFLPHPDVDGAVAIVHLSGEDQRRKRALFDCYATQRQTLAYIPVDVECFRPSPAYDFRQPPHEGKLFYECQPWGMTASRFHGLAAQAMAELALEGRL
jgi:N-acetylglucosamine malate deacetylase 2